jgi:hypothetical protein
MKVVNDKTVILEHREVQEAFIDYLKNVCKKVDLAKTFENNFCKFQFKQSKNLVMSVEEYPCSQENMEDFATD